MTRLFLALLACSLSAQIPAGPEKTAELQSRFSAPLGVEEPLGCRITPLGSHLGFALHSAAGYAFGSPLTEFNHQAGQIEIAVRATPRSAVATPLYFTWTHQIPAVPDNQPATGAETGVEQWLPLPPANYRIEVRATDNRKRVCRAAWDADVPPSPLPPRIRPLHRVTLMIDGGLTQHGRSVVDSASALFAWLPAENYRVVAFDLNSERELFRSSAFSPAAFDQVVQALQSSHAVPVDLQVLQQYPTPASFLAGLIMREAREPAPADLTIFLSYPEASGKAIVADSLKTMPRTSTRFLYLELGSPPLTSPFAEDQGRTCMGGGTLVRSPDGMVPDPRGCPILGQRRRPEPKNPIISAMKVLHGRTLIIDSPADLAKALRGIASRLN